jgi:hypothetical protein
MGTSSFKTYNMFFFLAQDDGQKMSGAWNAAVSHFHDKIDSQKD